MGRKPTHGHSRYPAGRHARTPTYVSWESMLARCTRPTHSGFRAYGAAGITVCERWRSFENFLADMGERPAGMTLDRFPNKGGNYEPGNCRWATAMEQARNKKNSFAITAGGVTAIAADWSIRNGLAASTIRDRIRRGWSPEDAVTRPSRPIRSAASRRA